MNDDDDFFFCVRVIFRGQSNYNSFEATISTSSAFNGTICTSDQCILAFWNSEHSMKIFRLNQTIGHYLCLFAASDELIWNEEKVTEFAKNNRFNQMNSL